MANISTETIKALTRVEFDQLRSDVIAEQNRRDAAPAVQAAQAEIITNLRTKGTITNPAPPPTNPTKVTDFPAWVNPGTDHSKMYMRGQRVSRNSKIWESQVNMNSWEPGGAGVYDNVWLDVTATALPTTTPTTTPEVLPFKQPTGAQDAYAKGARVTFEGFTWESLIDANTYSPTAYPAGWKKV